MAPCKPLDGVNSVNHSHSLAWLGKAIGAGRPVHVPARGFHPNRDRDRDPRAGRVRVSADGWPSVTLRYFEAFLFLKRLS